MTPFDLFAEHEPEAEAIPAPRPVQQFGLFEEGSLTTQSPGAGVQLGAPLRPPLRAVTPHGAFGYVRYDDPKGPGSSGEPFYKGQRPRSTPHQGVDLVAQRGEPVLSLGKGRAVEHLSGRGGKTVALMLDNGYRVVYADLGTVLVRPGDRVELGTPVARVGNNFVHVAVKLPGSVEFTDPRGIVPYYVEG